MLLLDVVATAFLLRSQEQLVTYLREHIEIYRTLFEIFFSKNVADFLVADKIVNCNNSFGQLALALFFFILSRFNAITSSL